MDVQRPMRLPLVPEATHVDLDEARQLPRQELHMDARPTVDVWRVLVGQQKGLHGHTDPIVGVTPRRLWPCARTTWRSLAPASWVLRRPASCCGVTRAYAWRSS